MKTYTKELARMLADRELGPEIVVIGGGTGLSTMLRGLKKYTEHITAIVSVADDGGSSGLLRKDYGILPPGDIRNCLLALADVEVVMEELMNYRFCDGQLSGQNFGNLFLTALTNVSGNFYDAIRNFSRVLAVVGRVLPVSLQDLHIMAELVDGSVIQGESAIGARSLEPYLPIKRIIMDPLDAQPLMESVEAILNADLVILGPGSLYTSIIPNLLFKDICEALRDTEAHRVYVCNIMTQPAETMNYTCTDHVKAVVDHISAYCAEPCLDYCLANSAPVAAAVLQDYAVAMSEPVEADRDELTEMGIELITRPLVKINDGKIRHDTDILAVGIIQLALNAREQAILNAKTKVYKREETI